MEVIFKKYASYYNLLYANKDYTAEVDYIEALLKKYRVKHPPSFTKTSTRLLDLGCGTGRHAKYFLQKNYSVVGVDLSPEMVAIAKESVSKTNEQYLVGDVRSIRLEDKFDMVSSLFHVASYQNTLADLGAFIETAALHLERGGMFLFDFWYQPAVLAEPPELRVKRISEQGFDLVRIAEPKHDREKAIVEVNYDIFIKKISEEKWEHFQERHTMRYWSKSEIKKQLKSKGFSCIRFYSWMQFMKPTHRTWSALVVCQKA